MKKLYMLSLALLPSLCASAAAGDWITVADFDTTTPAFELFKGTNGTAEVVELPTDADAGNHALKYINGGYSAGVQLKITLPEGKTIADYKALKLDVYNYNTTYKALEVYVDGTQIYKVDNVVGGESTKGTWVTNEHELEVSGTSNELMLGFYFNSSSNAEYAFDNIQLQEKAEAVAPGTYHDTANGTTADGWLMLQDYQTKTPGDNAAIWGQYGSPAATGTIAIDPDDPQNLIAEYSGGDFNSYMEVSVTLPEGKTLKDYKTVAFDLYRFADDDNHKKINVWADNEAIHQDENYIEQAQAAVWTPKSYAIPEDTEIGNTFLLHFGISTDKGHYAVDNVRLEEREQSEEPEKPVEPTEYNPTANGTLTDGVLMVNDFQHHNAAGIELPTWARDGHNAAGTAVTAEDPTDAKNLAAHFIGGNYNTVHEMDVTLPEGKTLADYKTISFDLYRHADDDNYKKMRVQADDQVLHYDSDYVQQAPATKWEEKSYDIPADATPGNSFKLRLGIESDKANYLIDNVRLTRRATTGIEGVAADSNAEAEYFNMQGMRVAQPEAGRIYIVRRGGKATKELVK